MWLHLFWSGILTLLVNIPISSFLSINLIRNDGNLDTNIYKKFTEQGENTIQLNLDKYMPGSYILKLNALNYEKTFKVIISK